MWTRLRCKNVDDSAQKQRSEPEKKDMISTLGALKFKFAAGKTRPRKETEVCLMLTRQPQAKS
eukprot:9485686-Pyramimonas_sp.AAC.4